MTRSEQLATNRALMILERFMSTSQIAYLAEAVHGEESEYFIEKIAELANTCETMSKTYEQDGKGDDAIVYLHYFIGSADWFITEKDIEMEQHQAFGLADLGYGGELGYISIEELKSVGAELDFHWTPKKLGIVKASRS